MENSDAVMNLVAANKNVVGVAPYVLGPVLMETEPANDQQPFFAVPYVRGADPLRETSVSVLPQSIIAGKFDLSRRGLVIGTALAQSLNLAVGDRVAISSPNDLKKMKEHQGKSDEQTVIPDDYTVTGIFDVGYNDYNYSIVVTSLENAQDLYDLGDSVHGLMVMLRDPYQAGVVSHELTTALGPSYTITTWMQENSAILSALIVEKNVMFYLLFFIVLVAALCILSAQITFVVQKTREIGMLKALGATNLQISGIFLGQSAIIGALGVLAGYGLGILALTYRNEFLQLMNHWTGFELFPASIYGFSTLPAIIDARDIVVICGSSFIICILGGVLPAWRAGRLKPVEALRYE
jgi:lipoprotein-releasing system permease protein